MEAVPRSVSSAFCLRQERSTHTGAGRRGHRATGSRGPRPSPPRRTGCWCACPARRVNVADCVSGAEQGLCLAKVVITLTFVCCPFTAK